MVVDDECGIGTREFFDGAIWRTRVLGVSTTNLPPHFSQLVILRRLSLSYRLKKHTKTTRLRLDVVYWSLVFHTFILRSEPVAYTLVQRKLHQRHHHTMESQWGHCRFLESIDLRLCFLSDDTHFRKPGGSLFQNSILLLFSRNDQPHV